MEQPWFEAYKGLLEDYFQENLKNHDYEEAIQYYANVCFIYLNDDEIPELLFSQGYIPFNYDDRCNTRNYLYTYKDGEIALLAPDEDVMDDFYGYQKPFSYVERKGMVYCDYYYIYNFSTFDDATGRYDNVRDWMSRIDTWDFNTLSCTSSNANIEIHHAVYNHYTEDYDDANFYDEYYVNVSEIIRDKTTGDVKEIVGDKVDKETYEVYEKALWKGEEVTTLSVEDFDKIYIDDDLKKALAQCYEKP